MVKSNSPDICLSSSNCASNFLQVLSTTWQQQESEKLNKLLKESQKRKLSYCCLFPFFFPSGSICIESRAADWCPSDWHAISWWRHWPWMHEGAFLCIVSFVYLTSCIYRFAEWSLQFANDCLIQLAPSSRFLWCGPNPTSRPIMTAHISAKPFLNCPQGWQGNRNIHRNSNITEKTLTSWHLSLPVLGQLLTVYFLELNPVWS